MPGFVLVAGVGAEGKTSGEWKFEGANDPGEVGITEVAIHGSPLETKHFEIEVSADGSAPLRIQFAKGRAPNPGDPVTIIGRCTKPGGHVGTIQWN